MRDMLETTSPLAPSKPHSNAGLNRPQGKKNDGKTENIFFPPTLGMVAESRKLWKPWVKAKSWVMGALKRIFRGETSKKEQMVCFRKLEVWEKNWKEKVLSLPDVKSLDYPRQGHLLQ